MLNEKLKMIARKVHNFIERVRMSESDYLTMKEQSNKFENMMHRFKKSQSATLSINIDEMLKNGGILYDKERVQPN